MNDPKDLDPRGIKWMGDVPDNWGKEPVKRHYEIQLGKMLQNNPSTDNDILVPYLKALHVLWGRVEKDNLPEMWANPKEIQQYSVQDGDLLVCEGGEVGRAGIVKSPPEKCIIQNALHRIRPKKSSDVCFFQWVLHTVSSSGWFDVLCNRATIAHFTREKVANLRIPVPQKDVQCAIASFLDRKTEHIDTLILKKERQIELLQERRVALISNVITKGLDPSVKMKNSGIKWLGEIPFNWKIIKLKYLGSIRYGLGQPPKELADGLPLIRATNIERGKINPKGLIFVDPNDIPYNRDPILRTNDIIVVRSGAYTGDSAIIRPEYDGAISGYDMVVRVKDANPKFIAYSLLSIPVLNCQIDLCRLRAAQPHLNAEELGECLFFIPSLPQQIEIVQYLDKETLIIDEIIDKIHGSVTQLHEYRKAIVSAAVTGKIDVRNAA